MSKREKFVPADLGHLEDKALAIKNYFEASHDDDRSEEYREYMLEKAESLTNTLVRDFAHYFDKYEISGIVPYGLDEKAEEKKRLKSQATEVSND